MPDFGAIHGVEREHLASGRALDRFIEDWPALDESYRRDLALSEATVARARIEATYVIRTLSAFEEALRARLASDGVTLDDDAGFRTKCERAGARFRVDDGLRRQVEAMVEDRNTLMHGRDLVPRESIRVVAGRCRRFLAACG